MAYPIVPAPYGFKPVSEFGGLVYAGSTRMYPIATGYGTSLFNGDIVQLSGGTVVTTTMSAASTPGTAVAGTLGIFVGAEYVNSSKQTVRAQYYPASTTSDNMQAYVIDDPRTVFKAVVVGQPTAGVSNTASTVGYVNPSFIGSNMYAVTGTAGNVNTGDSAMAVSGNAPGSNGTGNVRTTTAYPFRVVGVVPDTAFTTVAIGSTSGSSTTVTLTAANSNIVAGMQLIASGTGSAQGNYISVTNVNGTTLTDSSAVTLASGTQISFVGYPEVLVVWNQGYQGMTIATGA
jgi:hypothetical protein